ncbi:DUF1642 domain-containing protein [Lacticaseibacillus paracasei subsp. paracasei]|uniref:DUF1642 domain-containing protein n=1 Tax=Lacticaseibacillus paracasei TaxID=1597 RepID=UPI001F46F511|nr:DUF1642 domain-containing protein [Lacticaseibacillus paracasei]UJS06918.1 DUF1642 domain-containing protein [Lacticaseibacillus paracasei subsp. paracasei]
MSNETKRDVFKVALDDWKQNFISSLPRDGSFEDWSESLSDYSARYSTALPDDLPVIPEAVGEWIKKCKHRNVTLADTLCMEMRPENVRNWMAFKDGNVANDFDRAGYLRKQDLMASAWLLGVWRVEETGEILKLEAEK